MIPSYFPFILGVACIFSGVGESRGTTLSSIWYPATSYHGTFRIRLAGGSAENEGRVEVYHNGAWGTVCDEAWDVHDAEVVCRELGLPTSNVEAHIQAYFGSGSGTILLSDVACYGWEESLAHCSFRGWNIGNCLHSEDAGVRCGECNIVHMSP